MSTLSVVRAWKDAKYRRTLSAAELAQLPENPAGPVELSDSELRKAGGLGGEPQATVFASVRQACPTTTALTCTETKGGCCFDLL